MITILYTFRNRDIRRIKNSLDSLVKQVSQNFNVIFVDYGSNDIISSKIKELLNQYDFVTYIYLFTEEQPWNKCKALNYGIKKLESDYCFTADADMIFHSKFTGVLEKYAEPNKATYFQVGFLNEEESLKEVSFENYKTNFLTNNEATGMTLFPVEKLKLINGFDEFFHFWGAEDTDIHNRLKNIGCEIVYYDAELLLLHQWHKNYRSRETQELSNELQLSGIVELNHKHLVYNLESKATKINSESWGVVIDNTQCNELSGISPKMLSAEKSKIDHFLYYELPNSTGKTIAIQIKKDGIDQFEVKSILKKLLGRKVAKHYTLKEINDLLLMHIVSFYHKYPYSYKISEDLKSITFKIKKQEV